jgi:hypothetical protein
MVFTYEDQNYTVQDGVIFDSKKQQVSEVFSNFLIEKFKIDITATDKKYNFFEEPPELQIKHTLRSIDLKDI